MNPKTNLLNLYMNIKRFEKNRILNVIESVLNQSERDFKFYIINGNNVPEINDLVESYVKQDSRVELCEKFPRSICRFCVMISEYWEYFPTFLEEMVDFINLNKIDSACCQCGLNDDIIVSREMSAEQFNSFCNSLPVNGSFICRSEIWNESGMLSVFADSEIFGVASKKICKNISENTSQEENTLNAVNRIEFLINFLALRKTSRPEFLEIAYNDYIDSIMPVIRNNNVSLKTVIHICNCNYTVFPALWKIIKNRSKLMDFLETFSETMISIGEVWLGIDDAEIFCKTGEIICGVLEQPQKWLYFQKLKIALRIQNSCYNEAEEALSEIEELIPDDEFISDAFNLIEKSKRIKSLMIDEITDFEEYLDYLEFNKDKFIILIAAADTPWGPGLSQLLCQKLLDLGLQINLFGKFRNGYVAAIDCGKRILEKLTDLKVEAEGSFTVNGIEFKLISHGIEVAPPCAKFIINNEELKLGGRGLNFVIYDKNRNFIIDEVNFDTYSDNNVCTRPDELPNALLKWKEDHPEVGLMTVRLPLFPKDNLSEKEQFILKNGITRATGQNFPENPNLPIRQFYTDINIINEVLATPRSYFNSQNVRRFEDISGRAVNIASGHRITMHQPKEAERTIYVCGTCRVFGIGNSDEHTVESQLQLILNQKYPDKNFIVQNYGFFLADTDRKKLEPVQILNSLPLKHGDIVICDWGNSKDIPCADLFHIGVRPHNYGEIFLDTWSHLTPNANKLVAEGIANKLNELNFFDGLAKNIQDKSEPVQNTDSVKSETEELKDYKNTLRGIYEENFSVGAIVMNCNPFTLGHRYLIEQASNRCGHLIIFVVSEDKSFFKFKDRFKLVKEGTADLDNVTVLPSGQFILSSMTFSEYFNKSELQDRVIDSTTDVSLFAKEIAPCLHITKRFVGTEPFDTVTKQYNNDMKAILPQFGIELIEIPRFEKDGIVISASEVRRCMKSNDMVKLKSIVPETTYKFICDNLSELNKSV